MPVRPAAPLTSVLAQPAQAAAQQNSIAPLLQNLATATARLSHLPQPVADAAAKLLAARLPVDRGITAETLKNAVLRSGVLLDPPARTGAQPADVKSSLLQLRAGLLAILGSHDATAAEVGRRPPPPTRDAMPRGMLSEGPTLAADASPRDSARTMLHQTDAALSRLKLTQLASQPDALVRSTAAAPDFRVELPMMLGAELGMMQLQVQRDGKQSRKPGERGWRVRFAVSFSAIGEVGAQVSLLGKTTNVMVWANEPATADALEAMLPDLTPALAAHGLTVGSVRLRRSVPEPEHPASSGRLMDTVT